MTKQNEEKKENGAAQMVVPSNLILAGIVVHRTFVRHRHVFIAGFKLITCRLAEDLSLPHTIRDCLVSVNIEDYQVMKMTLARELNPLTINLSHVENMPSTPISYADLQLR